ncbi:MAG: hypothetical protein CL677_08745 [Bdellovibrionaceae bacterium]|nr:hypothetical protein [Pseudobdellovibrionaceae bacterium]|tara:strand:- start:33805 stop:34437 length:633 start_codon:yes stop_codon:yes gene_type:complete
MRFLSKLLLAFSVFTTSSAWSAPAVGKREADSYFIQRSQNPQVRARKQRARLSNAHYLAIHFGGFIRDDAYVWGPGDEENVGEMAMSISYQFGEWVNSTDLLMRVDFTRFDLEGGESTKMSIMPLVTFPDAKSGFPLYFGAGIGGGVFFKQIDGESTLSFDYQMLVGARFFDVFGEVGLSVETGLKNHIHLLSDGQFNSTFVQAGTVFVF